MAAMIIDAFWMFIEPGIKKQHSMNPYATQDRITRDFRMISLLIFRWDIYVARPSRI
jgi:hypothetical protein